MSVLKSVTRLLISVVVSLAGTSTVAFSEEAVPRDRGQITLTFAPVVKKVAPAVVNIYARKTVRRAVSPFANDPLLQRFFGGAQLGVPREQIENALGSGVLVRADGIVVTNNHVIEGADEITVVLHDRREFAAKLVGTDRESDLAVLRLVKAPKDLPTVPLGTTDSLEVGDVVLALGNPFGVGQTVTMGIVSALARSASVSGTSTVNTFIQTDAAINPGNSGGALVTEAGTLVGINSMIYSRDGGSMGIGFAIPVEMVKTVVAGMLQEGKVVHPWFGADGQPVTADIASSLGLDRPSGALIKSVVAGSSAAEAGLKVGDVVTAVDGRDVADFASLRYHIATGEIGGKVTLSIIRDGHRVSVVLPLAAAPEIPARDEWVVSGENPLQGAKVANENPALANEAGIPYRPGTVVVSAVNNPSYAARFGVQPGDVLVSVNGTRIDSVKTLRSVLGQERTGGWTLSIDRQGRTLSIQVR